MAWLQQVQTVVTIATGAVAAWVGYQQFELSREVARLNGELEKQRVALEQQAEARLQEEQERRFNFDVFKLAIDSIKQDDPDLQRALVAYFESLAEGGFRRQMLVLFRSGSGDPVTAKSASLALGREIEVAQAGIVRQPPTAAPLPGDGLSPEQPQPAPGPAALENPMFRTLAAGRAEGWDYDLFVCESTLERDDPALPATTERLIAILKSFDPVHGRIRLQPLEEAVRNASLELATPGLFLLLDQSDEAERLQGERLRERLALDDFAFEARANREAPSPWYISLFYCPT